LMRLERSWKPRTKARIELLSNSGVAISKGIYGIICRSIYISKN